MRVRLRRSVAVGASLLLLGACGGDNPKLTKPKKNSGTTSTTAPSASRPSSPGDDAVVTTESRFVEPEAYTDSGDYQNGRHAGQVKSFDRRSVGVDVVQFLTGAEAKEAYAEDTGSTDGPDNDYYVRNQSKTVRNLPVDRHVVVRVNNTGGYPPSDPDEGHEVSVETFQSYFDEGKTAGVIFWFTIEDGLVISIEEQYVP